MKKFLLILSVVAFMVSCNSQKANEETVNEENIMTVDELQANFENLVDSLVVFKGEVDHVCKHGGTRMVVFNPETDNSIHVEAGESGNFRADEVANHEVIVYGKVLEMKVDDLYIENLQAELDEELAKGDSTLVSEEADKAKDAEHHDEGAAPHNDNKHKEEIEQRVNQIKNLKEKLAELKAQGKNHISYYSVECTKYQVVDDAEEATKDEAPAYETETHEAQ
ncbi:MAG: hypothetical protein JXR34_08530 [Bacteroidales bacterium]|nr:hypothetical protein [Bacteroidales bacterium]